MPRKTAPKVKGGRVAKKNNWEPTSSRPGPSKYPDFERRRPVSGCRHLLKRRDIERFIALLPDRDELAGGLHTVVLDDGSDWTMGWHDDGVVAICPWEEELWWLDTSPAFVQQHRDLFRRLGVDCAKAGSTWVVRWTEGQARAFQLLHVFLHELGHHHDRMTTSSKRGSARGEPYAESYANRYLDRIWEAYLGEFAGEL